MQGREERRQAGRTPNASRNFRDASSARQRLECVELAPAFGPEFIGRRVVRPTRHGDRIFFTSNTGIDAAFVANVSWSNLNGTGGTVTGGFLLGTGPFELVPMPEPGTIFAGCLLVGIFGWTERKRLRRLFPIEDRS